jgi:hypothetical protein
VDTCSHCGAGLPERAAYCPSCGRPTDADVVTEVAHVEPIDVQHAEPRYFGLGPPVFVLAVAALLLVLGVLLVVFGNLAFGVLAIVVAVALFPTFLAGARRWPDHPVARVGLSTADRARDEAGVAVDSISTWSRAGREVVRVRKEQFTLRRERDAKIRELGVSAYEDDGRVAELRAAAKEIDERIEQNERELQRTLAAARRRVRKGRAAVVSTEVIGPDESGPLQEGAAEPPAGEGRGADPADEEAAPVDVEKSS